MSEPTSLSSSSSSLAGRITSRKYTCVLFSGDTPAPSASRSPDLYRAKPKHITRRSNYALSCVQCLRVNRSNHHVSELAGAETLKLTHSCVLLLLVARMSPQPQRIEIRAKERDHILVEDCKIGVQWRVCLLPCRVPVRCWAVIVGAWTPSMTGLALGQSATPELPHLVSARLGLGTTARATSSPQHTQCSKRTEARMARKA